MYKILYICILSLFLFINPILSQSKSLKFKQVKLITTSSQTVPGNCVWKVTGIFTDNTSLGNFSETNTPAILVNGVKNYYMLPMPIGSGTYFAVVEAGFPVWFPANTTIAASNKVKYINAIEFEIVP